MKSVITVIGKDKVGIIHQLSGKLSQHKINILDITQTIMQQYFTMIMIVDIANLDDQFDSLSEELEILGQQIGVDIRIQHENIFEKMHSI